MWLGILTAALVALIGGGAIWSNAQLAPKLALDLEGGTSIILAAEVDESTEVTQEQLDQAVAIIRQRVDATGVSEAEITTQGDRNIVVNLPGNPDEETRELVRSSAQLSFRRVALVTDPRSAAQMEEANSTATATDAPSLSEEEQARLDEVLGNTGGEETPAEGEEEPAEGAEPSDAATAGGDVAEPTEAAPSAGTADQAESAPASSEPATVGTVPGPAGNTAGTPAAEAPDVTEETFPRFDPAADTSWMFDEDVMADFQELDCTDPANRTGGERGDPEKPVVACAADGSAKMILGPVELDGSHVSNAEWGYESTATGAQTTNPAVTIEFDDYGTDVFGQITSAITGQQQPYDQFAIVLDGLVLSAPASQTPVLDGRAQITGNFTVQGAETLANQLKNGALPISFEVQSEQQISPTLGSEYLTYGMIAGLIGLLAVVVYSLFQYRMLGLLTVSSLVVAGILTYLLLLFVGWRYGYRLSLAGVAGIIVGIGMTADSFIVYFERVRDELRAGRKLLSAVEVGWDRAKRTIYASKTVNMLAAVILYVLAVGSVRGFAFTLGLTVIIDILLVVLFTHPMLQVLARTRFFGEGHPWSGMDPRLLGVKAEAYRGAMGLDVEKAAERAAAEKRDSGKEAKRREKARKKRETEARNNRAAAGAATSGGLSLAQRKALAAEEAAAERTSETDTKKDGEA